MNHYPLVARKLFEFKEQFPEYSIGNILYSAICVKVKGGTISKGDIFDIDDAEMYELLSKALSRELDNKE